METKKAPLYFLHGKTDSNFTAKYANYEGHKGKFELHLDDEYGENIKSKTGMNSANSLVNGLFEVLESARDFRRLSIVSPIYAPGFRNECKRLGRVEGESGLCELVRSIVCLEKSAANLKSSLLLGQHRNWLESQVGSALHMTPGIISKEDILDVFARYAKDGRGMTYSTLGVELDVPSYVAKKWSHDLSEEGRLYLQGNVYYLNQRVASARKTMAEERRLALPEPRLAKVATSVK